MKHVDGYSTTFPARNNAFYRDDGERGSLSNPLRYDDDGTYPLPARSGYEEWDARWNGYVYYTQPHEDGECSEHRPGQGQWKCSEGLEGETDG